MRGSSKVAAGVKTNEIYFQNTVALNYQTGTVALSSCPDQACNWAVDDAVRLVVDHPDGSDGTVFIESFTRFLPARDVTSLFRRGENSVTIQLVDLQGRETGLPRPLYLVQSGNSNGDRDVDNSNFLSEGPPFDGDVMAPGAKFSKLWAIENTGTATWSPASYRIIRVGGTFGPSTMQLHRDVAPKTAVSILWNDFTAPTQEGIHRATYQITGPNGIFGDRFWVEIKVGGGTTIKPQCSNGIDDDKDGKTDLSDPGCGNDAGKNSEVDKSKTSPKTQCEDGLDNDADGRKDLEDPGCENSRDKLEFDFVCAYTKSGSCEGEKIPEGPKDPIEPQKQAEDSVEVQINCGAEFALKFAPLLAAGTPNPAVFGELAATKLKLAAELLSAIGDAQSAFTLLSTKDLLKYNEEVERRDKFCLEVLGRTHATFVRATEPGVTVSLTELNNQAGLLTDAAVELFRSYLQLFARIPQS